MSKESPNRNNPFKLAFWLRVDRNANADIFDGEREETMSSRMGRRLLKGYKGFLNWRYNFCKMISWIEKVFNKADREVRHCIESVHKKA